MTRRPHGEGGPWADDRTVVDAVARFRFGDAVGDVPTTDSEATLIIERRATELGSRFELPDGGSRHSAETLFVLRTFLRRRGVVVVSTALLLIGASAAAFWQRAGQSAEAQAIERRATAMREQQEARQEEVAKRARERALVRQQEDERVQAFLDAFVRERRERLAGVKMRETILSEIRGRRRRAQAVPDAIAKERSELENAGADLLAANNHREALPVYRKLAAAFPEEPSFSHLVLILEKSTRCEEGETCR